MVLTGVSACGVELAETLAALLKRHGYIEATPKNLDELMTACNKAISEPKPAFVLVQEGGSSTEMYVHAWDSLAEAEQDRINCTKDGSYRTSEIVEVPGAIANQPGFFEAVEDIVKAASQTLDYVEVPDEGEGPDPVFARSEEIKAEYLASGCQASDVDEAVEKLMSCCGELFQDDRAAWEFLMEEPHEDNEHED